MRNLWQIKANYDTSFIPYTKVGNVLYGANYNTVASSSDWWNTLSIFGALPQGAGQITAIHRLNSGVLLIGTGAGRVYRTIAPFTTFTLVLQMTAVAYPRTWSITSKGSLAFVSEYGALNLSVSLNATRVYMSKDNGLSFTQNYQVPFDSKAHIHKILIDPYTDVLWVSNGDAPTSSLRMLLPPYYDTATVVSTSIQPTGGLVFEDFFLWVQDSYPYGVFKHNKADNSLALVLDLANDYPQYADTAYEGIIHDPTTNKVYFATKPDVLIGRDVGVFCSDYPYTSWSLISKIPSTPTSNSTLELFSGISSDGKEIVGFGNDRTIHFKHFSKALRT